jgi:hypothetical protein
MIAISTRGFAAGGDEAPSGSESESDGEAEVSAAADLGRRADVFFSADVDVDVVFADASADARRASRDAAPGDPAEASDVSSGGFASAAPASGAWPLVFPSSFPSAGGVSGTVVARLRPVGFPSAPVPSTARPCARR